MEWDLKVSYEWDYKAMCLQNKSFIGKVIKNTIFIYGKLYLNNVMN